MCRFSTILAVPYSPSASEFMVSNVNQKQMLQFVNTTNPIFDSRNAHPSSSTMRNTHLTTLVF